MAKEDVKAFLKIKREGSSYRPIDERVNDYEEVFILRDLETTSKQGKRCMECGTPFCHWGCPLGNYVPEYNDFIAHGEWKKAYDLLAGTNNFPEFTGRICPAFCESGCVLGINDDAVTCRENELDIIEQAYEQGYVQPKPPSVRTGKTVAVVGSGPAGLAVADQLNKAGHTVVVFEKDEEPGGWLRYGIPDFKLDKSILDRRFDIMKEEGVEFKCLVNVGVDIKSEDLLKEYDSVVLSGGSRKARDLPIKGRDLKGIYFAGDFLVQSNKRIAGIDFPKEEEIVAVDKKVVVIGGGDTGSDCVGTANRQMNACLASVKDQGASTVEQIEILVKPAKERQEDQPWPYYPMLLKTTSSHKEGVRRTWSVITKEFIGDDSGNVSKILCAEAEDMKEIPDSEFTIDADIVLLAVGFVHPEHVGLLDDLGLEYDNRGNVKTSEDFMTSLKGVFSCGDMHTGQSLVMKAIAEGRTAAFYVDCYLTGSSELPKM